MALIVGIGIANAAERDANSISRSGTKQNTSARQINTPVQRVTARQPVQQNTSRATTTKITTRPNNTQRTRGATTPRTTQNVRPTTTARSAISTTPRTTQQKKFENNFSIRPARATIITPSQQSNTFGTGYNNCRAAYFTCMDQFCANANDQYRRCICSSKLTEIQAKESALSQTADQIQDFKNLNLSVIDKSASEVNAMLNATSGEYAQSIAVDTSDSGLKLAGINDILSKSKQKSLSTQGTLDIAGDIKQIWATTDLTGGANIANLSGEALYNAVHAQCSELVSSQCQSDTIKDMITSAYGMYIENDCSLLINELATKKNSASATIRETEREMNLARLENYNAHNSTSINDCIAQVRLDITSDSACGKDYVHCLDTSGRYLNIQTGEPIYSPEFYQLDGLTSLSGDVLTNQTNRMIVAHLNKLRNHANRGLDTCRDLADTVWDEFMRQAIAEIAQGQQERIRKVKNECLSVVNNCYDEKSKSLKDFSNIDNKESIGANLELSEQMCREKLDACSNLYGGGPTGMESLVTAMRDIVTQEIGKQCTATLRDYTQKICAVPGNDTIHSYPYGCRIYNPGEQRYANIAECNRTATTEQGSTDQSTTIIIGLCPVPSDNSDPNAEFNKIYTSCKEGFYLADKNNDYKPDNATQCKKCPDGYTCLGGTADKTLNTCGTYVGSLYQKLVRYAKQACVRPSESENDLPKTILQDINTVMDEIQSDMANELSTECTRLGGVWVSTKYKDSTDATDADITTGKKKTDADTTTGKKKFDYFYRETSANTDWGFCASKEATPTYTVAFNNNTEDCEKCGYSHSAPINVLYGAKFPTITPPENAVGDACTFKGYKTSDGTKEIYDDKGMSTEIFSYDANITLDIKCENNTNTETTPQ